MTENTSPTPASARTPSTVSARTSEVTVKANDPTSILDFVKVSRSAGEIDEKLLLDATDSFKAAMVGLHFAMTQAGVTQKDCVEIHTGDCTTIRINCPIVIMGEPTID